MSTDEAAAIVERARQRFGENLTGTHDDPGGLWLRVNRDVWADTAQWLRHDEGFAFFNFLSAIDWMPSPYGRDMDSTVDTALNPEAAPPGVDGADDEDATGDAPDGMETGVTGGDTRFQVFARVNDPASHRSLIVKADLPDDDLRVGSWVPVYEGANWHEREAWEMFGITFDGHPGLRHLYLPGEFEGNPLRKDYPLLARRVKPWPGIVDVELMPDEDESPETAASPAEAGAAS